MLPKTQDLTKLSQCRGICSGICRKFPHPVQKQNIIKANTQFFPFFVKGITLEALDLGLFTNLVNKVASRKLKKKLEKLSV